MTLSIFEVFKTASTIPRGLSKTSLQPAFLSFRVWSNRKPIPIDDMNVMPDRSTTVGSLRPDVASAKLCST